MRWQPLACRHLCNNHCRLSLRERTFFRGAKDDSKANDGTAAIERGIMDCHPGGPDPPGRFGDCDGVSVVVRQLGGVSIGADANPANPLGRMDRSCPGGGSDARHDLRLELSALFPPRRERLPYAATDPA